MTDKDLNASIIGQAKEPEPKSIYNAIIHEATTHILDQMETGLKAIGHEKLYLHLRSKVNRYQNSAIRRLEKLDFLARAKQNPLCDQCDCQCDKDRV